jgi:hypothetical protein
VDHSKTVLYGHCASCAGKTGGVGGGVK